MWLQHPVYSNYMVSDLGKVKHVMNSKCRAHRLDKDGYERINISFKGVTITVKIHTMVAQCFVSNPKGLLTVNHIDGDKLNNTSGNLEWMSAEDNVSDSYNRPHKKCHPVIVDGVAFRSKREAERVTGLSRATL